MAAKQRQANFELLRVLSMFLIIIVHILGTGTSHNPVSTEAVTFGNGFWLNSAIYPFLMSIGSMGVILYVLITSYFICQSNVLKIDRIVKVWLPTAFYTVLFSIIFFSFGKISGKQLALSLFPVGTNQYWFVTKYIALVCLAPLLAFVVNNLDNRGFICALVVLSLLIVHITHGIPYGLQFFKDSPFSVATFVLIFFIAAYIRRFELPEFLTKYSLWIAIGVVLIQGALGVIDNLISPVNDVIMGGFGTGYNSLSLIPATCVFIWFKEHSFDHGRFSKFMVRLAPFTFGIYLIHENPLFRDYLWGKLANPSIYWHSPCWLGIVVLMTLAIFFGGALVDFVRAQIFKAFHIDKISEKLCRLNVNFKTNILTKE